MFLMFYALLAQLSIRIAVSDSTLRAACLSYIDTDDDIDDGDDGDKFAKAAPRFVGKVIDEMFDLLQSKPCFSFCIIANVVEICILAMIASRGTILCLIFDLTNQHQNAPKKQQQQQQMTYCG
jgi:hypothetical protein